MLKENMTDDACRMSWINISIGDLGRVVTGDTPPKKNPEFYGGRYPFIKPTDMKVGERHTHLCEDYYSDEAFEKYKKKLIPPGATAVVTIGSIGQKITFIDRECFVNQAVNAVIPDVDKYDPLFVFYLLKNNLNLVKCADTGASSGRENVSKSNFSSLSVCVPECIEEQRKIGFLLGTYDDLIEVNSQHIQLLEESARLLYREWFIKLRFPNHEQTKIVDGIPEGWECTNLGALSKSLQRGITPKYDDSAKWIAINQKCIRDKKISLDKSRYQSKEVQPEKLVQSGDVLINSTGAGTLGRVAQAWVVGENWTVDTHITIARPLPSVEHAYFGLLLAELEPLFEAMGKGATNQLELSRHDIAALEIVAPTLGLQKDFSKIVSPINDQLHNLLSINVRLRQARDALLPKLMSGELRC